MHKRQDRRRRAQGSGTESGLSVDHHRKKKCSYEKDLPVVLFVKDRFKNVLDYGTDYFPDKAPCYNDNVAQGVAKCGKRLQDQMKSHTVYHFDPFPLSVFVSFSVAVRYEQCT